MILAGASSGRCWSVSRLAWRGNADAAADTSNAELDSRHRGTDDENRIDRRVTSRPESWTRQR